MRAIGTAMFSTVNRGLGLELASQLLDRGWTVLGGHRGTLSHDLGRLGETAARGRLHLHRLDVTKADSVHAFAAWARTQAMESADADMGLTHPDGRPGAALDLLVNVAGIVGEGGPLPDLDADAGAIVHDTNVLGPLRLTQALLPLLGRGSIVANISSGMGSIAEASTGWLHYRMSKAALNMQSRVLANELRADGIIVTSFCPGWVQTDMGGANAPLTATESMAALLSTLADLTPADSGRFLEHTGAPIDW